MNMAEKTTAATPAAHENMPTGTDAAPEVSEAPVAEADAEELLAVVEALEVVVSALVVLALVAAPVLELAELMTAWTVELKVPVIPDILRKFISNVEYEQARIDIRVLGRERLSRVGRVGGVLEDEGVKADEAARR